MSAFGHDSGDELPSDVRGLLAARRGLPLPDGVAQRLRARMDGQLNGDQLNGDQFNPGGPAASAATQAARWSRRRWPRLSKGALAIGTFFIGVAAGALGLGAWQSRYSPAPIVLTLESALPNESGLHRLVIPPVLQTSVPVEESDSLIPPVVPPVLPPVAAATHPPSNSAGSESNSTTHHSPRSAGHDTDLATERALLEIARTAIARSDGKAALEALTSHARQFPHGRLEEERDSLWVQTLVQAGRAADARERAARFRRRYPSSLLLPAVDAALSQLP